MEEFSATSIECRQRLPNFLFVQPTSCGTYAHPCTFYAVQGSVRPEDNVSCLAHSADETVRDTPEVN